MSFPAPSFLEPWFALLADDPALLAVQASVIVAGAFLVFLVFYTTRDILLRTKNFWYMCISILLVALLPVVGFLLYLLIRPSRTLKERSVEDLLVAIHERLNLRDKKEAPAKK